MKRIPLVLSFAVAATWAGATANQAAQLPNIVLIYGDDIGYGDFSCYGATAVSTPNVDRLAREGLRFTDTYCTSATGDRVPCVYIENRRVAGLDPADPIQTTRHDPIPGEPTGKTHREKLKMDWSHGHNAAIVNGVSRIGHMKGGKAALWTDEDMADVFTEKALGFIERRKETPFFLFFAAQDVHVPRVPHPRFVGKTTMGPRGDAIVQFDCCVGEILKKLDELNLAGNTLVILTSDNGPALDDGYKDGAVEKLGDHKPAGIFRAGKYSPFEGGARMPFIVRWPGRVKPGVSSALISQVDLCATLGALAGQKPDPKVSPDSLDMLAALLGDSPDGRDALVVEANALALRAGNWKFIEPKKIRDGISHPWNEVAVSKPGFLFDLSTDPGETRNLAAEHPEKAREMAAALKVIAGR